VLYAVIAKISTFTAIRVCTTTGRRLGRAPEMVTGALVVRWACATQSTQCWPTDAGRRHSEQAGRSQRVHRSPVGRSGCRTQADAFGGPFSCPAGCPAACSLRRPRSA